MPPGLYYRRIEIALSSPARSQAAGLSIHGAIQCFKNKEQRHAISRCFLQNEAPAAAMRVFTYLPQRLGALISWFCF
jgi:hypothetical protein